MTRRRTHRFTTVVIAAVVAGSGWAAAQAAGVDVRDNSFAPRTVTVAVGDTVTWTQSGSNPHTVTAANGSFDSHPACPGGECMEPGDTFSHTFTTAGEVDYFCKIHGAAGQGMAGTVIIEAAAEEPPGDDPEEEPDAEDPAPEPDQEPDPADDPPDEPGTTDDEPRAGAGDESVADSGEAPPQGQDASAAADGGEELADTAGRWELLPLGLMLLLTGTVVLRPKRVRRS